LNSFFSQATKTFNLFPIEVIGSEGRRYHPRVHGDANDRHCFSLVTEERELVLVEVNGAPKIATPSLLLPSGRQSVNYFTTSIM
jgi:hypothetical protein